jgi:hypothetical protein
MKKAEGIVANVARNSMILQNEECTFCFQDYGYVTIAVG